MPQPPETTEAVRRFNRFYTRRIGVLEESLLGSGLTLSEARLVFELGRRGEWTAGGMAVELGLDAGYLSRLLGGLEKRELIARRPSEADGRQALVTLTAEGARCYGQLDQRSQADIATMLGALAPAARQRLLSAMATIEILLGDAGPDASAPRVPFLLRPHRPGDLGVVVSRHGALYAQEYGWDDTFEGFVAEVAADFLKRFDPKRERCWIAEREAETVGAVLLVRGPDERTAKLRLLYVEPAARGLGIGARLVEECRLFARSAGYSRIVLWTNSVLTSARRIYEAAGYRLIKSEPHHSFGKDLVGETWELEV